MLGSNGLGRGVLFDGCAHLYSGSGKEGDRPWERGEVKVRASFPGRKSFVALQCPLLKTHSLTLVAAEVFDRSKGITTGFGFVT